MSSVKFRKGDFKTYSAIESPDESTLYYVEDIGKIFKGSVDITSAVSFVTDREYISLMQGPVERIAKGKLYINLENNKILTRKKVENGRDEKFEVFPGFLLSEEDEKLFDSNFLVTGNQVKNYVSKAISANPSSSGDEIPLQTLQINDVTYKISATIFKLGLDSNDNYVLFNNKGDIVTAQELMDALYDKDHNPNECYIQDDGSVEVASLLSFQGFDSYNEGLLFRGNGQALHIYIDYGTQQIADIAYNQDVQLVPQVDASTDTKVLTSQSGEIPTWEIPEDQTARWDALVDDTSILISGTQPFTLKTANLAQNWNGTLQYSFDGLYWFIWNGTEISSSADNKIYLRGINNNYITGSKTSSGAFVFTTEGTIRIKGNLENLLDYQVVRNGGHPQMGERCFASLFNGCTMLEQAPELGLVTLARMCYHQMFKDCTSLKFGPTILPATTLAYQCYQYMFWNCGSLLVAPELPATTLSDYCYSYMFYQCRSLTTPPILPATNLENYCYQYMFADCRSLLSVPDLPGHPEDQYCYDHMFSGCTSLTHVPSNLLPRHQMGNYACQGMFAGCTNLLNMPLLPATYLNYACYQAMFENCTSLTALNYLPATTLASKCYAGMFRGCTDLNTLPNLPASQLPTDCYYEMFFGCTNIKLSRTETGEYTTLYSVQGSTVSAGALTNMFGITGGTYQGTPTAGAYYYTPNTIIDS